MFYNDVLVESVHEDSGEDMRPWTRANSTLAGKLVEPTFIIFILILQPH